MSQSMNGLSLFSENGISESDNISCNNLAANLITSNGILTDNLNATSTTGALANFSGLVSANKLTAANIHADTRIDCDLFECNRLDCKINGVFNAIDAAGNVSCTKVIFKDVTGNEVLDSIIVSNLNGLTSNVQQFINRISRDSVNAVTSGVNNLGLGQFALPQLTTGSHNVSLGFETSYDIISGSNNISIGKNTGSNNIDGSNNIAIGTNAGQATDPLGISYQNSVAIGNNAEYNTSNQIALGTVDETVLVRGTFICDSSISAQTLELSTLIFTPDILNNLLNLTTNVQDQFDKLAKNSLGSVTTGVDNLALGFFSGSSITTGSYNVSLGYDALFSMTTGYSNVGIGKYACQNMIEDSDCICIGVEAGKDSAISSAISNSVAIGSYSRFDQSNQIVLGTVYHTVKIDGKVQCSDIITKSKMKYGRVPGNSSNSLTVVNFDEPFPETGPMPFIQLTPIYESIYNTSPAFLFVVAYSYSGFAFDFIYNGTPSSATIEANWMAMVP
jgi:trimeric autotransporter adhesin